MNISAELGSRVFVNAGTSIDYHSTIEDDCFVGTGVAIPSSVTVGARSFIGAGVVCRPEVTIGPDCMLGAGAVVVRDLPGGGTYVGNPARAIGT